MSSSFLEISWLKSIFASLAFVIGFLVCGCSNTIEVQNSDKQVHPVEFTFERICANVTGTVLGEPYPDTVVELHRTENVNYSTVMQAARNGTPVAKTKVNRTKSFEFSCLDYGQYATVIPAASYNYSVGSPLPYEFDCQNYSLRIAFQGGDPTYSVGAFEILHPHLLNESKHSGPGSLYRPCPVTV